MMLRSSWLLIVFSALLGSKETLAQDAQIVAYCNRVQYYIYGPPPPKTNFLRVTPYVIGGKPALPKEFPHMARLGHRDVDNNTVWFCGGTLITYNMVLTAAHCFYGEGGDINVVRLGELDFDTDTDDAQPEDFGVRKLIEYPGYNYFELYHDIAIVQLNRGVRFNAYKLPACLPFTDNKRNESYIAVGWGHTSFGGTDSSILRNVKLYSFEGACKIADEIDELPRGFNESTQICIGSNQPRDTCSGDSGGPVLVEHADYTKMYHVMGITSVGIGCGTPNLPSIYTRVSYYLDWIKEEIAKAT